MSLQRLPADVEWFRLVFLEDAPDANQSFIGKQAQKIYQRDIRNYKIGSIKFYVFTDLFNLGHKHRRLVFRREILTDVQ